MSRLIVDVSSEQHQIIKTLAATEGKSIKDFVLERILPDTEGDEDAAWAELQQILSDRMRRAIAAADADPRADLSEADVDAHFDARRAAASTAQEVHE